MTSKQIQNAVKLLQGNPVSKISMALNMYREPQRKEIADYLGCDVNNIAITLSMKK